MLHSTLCFKSLFLVPFWILNNRSYMIKVPFMLNWKCNWFLFFEISSHKWMSPFRQKTGGCFLSLCWIIRAAVHTFFIGGMSRGHSLCQLRRFSNPVIGNWIRSYAYRSFVLTCELVYVLVAELPTRGTTVGKQQTLLIFGSCLFLNAHLNYFGLITWKKIITFTHMTT